MCEILVDSSPSHAAVIFFPEVHLQASLPHREVVLLGVGHTNAHVLRMWKMKPVRHARLTCISNQPIATYSGMLPGVLAGQYAPSRMEIDLVRLTAAAGARLLLDPVVNVDTAHREIHFADRPPIPFDVLSIGVGSVPATGSVDTSLPNLVPIKPMQSLLPRLNAAIDRLHGAQSSNEPASSNDKSPGPLRVAVVGGGAGGVEIAMCVPHYIRQHYLQQGWPSQPIEVHLFQASDQLLPGFTRQSATAVQARLAASGVKVHLRSRVASVTPTAVQIEHGESVPMDLVLWATSAVAPPLLQTIDLPKDERGFLLTDRTLRTKTAAPIYAVGDTGTIDGVQRPKSGVFAVRQGPVIWDNIENELEGESLREFRPQQDFLRLLNTGDGLAIGQYLGRTFESPWAWRWKDWIDSRFMKKYQDYTLAMKPTFPLESLVDLRRNERPPQMRCVGCGGKVGGSILSRVLQRLNVPSSDRVVVGLDNPDDAAIVRPAAQHDVAVTVDHFAAPLGDAYLVGRIGALNALSDCWAMGSTPFSALAVVELPFAKPGRERPQEQMLFELMSGALRELNAAGVTLVGGHTIEGPRLSLGFTVLADQPAGSVLGKSALQVGDQLVLTKPLGTGVLLAAHMEAKCRADWMLPLQKSLLTSNQAAAEAARSAGITAVTDVTGYGLAGHLAEMLTASQVSATLNLDAIPLLPGFAELHRQGVESTLAEANRHVLERVDRAGQQAPNQARPSAKFAALFDPQTCGGLLLGVPPQKMDELTRRLPANEWTVVGEVVSGEQARIEIA